MVPVEDNPTPAVASPKVLVVDDEPAARAALVELLREEGFTVRSAADGFKALGQLDEWTPDLVITDVKMPGMDGIELMAKVRERLEDCAVVVMTAFGSVEHAVSAMIAGADDYLTKPVHFPELLLVVRRVLANHELQRENARLRSALVGEPVADGIEWIGQSKQSRELLALVRQVADSDASVLIVGDSGTGKQLVARALHAWSARKAAPFIAIECSSFDEAAFDAELFGAGPRAPGGPREGRLAKAAGGTLLLDEVADLPPSAQVKLLRVLQERRYERVGSDAAEPIDVRIVAATHRDLYKEVRDGRFREDLFYRLDVITLRTPALAQRREDIPALAMHFLERHAKRSRKVIRGFSDRALRVLLSADWPGNARQLDNAIERAVVLCNEREIAPRHLPREVMTHARGADDAPVIPGASMADLERYAILKTLEHVRGSTSKAAEILGISPRKIQYRLAEYRGEGPVGTAEAEPSRASE